jgi:hypothetical protein
MTEYYRLHFGYKNDKHYAQALELANLAYKHEVLREGKDAWHIVTFTSEPDQVDLMAQLYLAKKPALQALSKEEQREWQTDMIKIYDKLMQEGYLRKDYKPPQKKPQEHLPQYQEIRELISNREYEQAVKRYYGILGDEYFGDFHGELIYLKRIGCLPLEGRDLLYYRPESSRNDFVQTNLSEYVDCINQVLDKRRSARMKSPLDIIIENVPTLEELIKRNEHDWHSGIRLMPGAWDRDNSQVTADPPSFVDVFCRRGRFFDAYPDQVQLCRKVECPNARGFNALWTVFSPEFYRTNVVDRGLTLCSIQVYRHKSWEWKDRKPDFVTLTSMVEMVPKEYGAHDVVYTGREHFVQGKTYYEVDLICRDVGSYKTVVTNPFIDIVNDILRDAENLLRENHGLPRIGEGWVTEMELYNLVKEHYSDALHHVSPPWLSPQHIDIFVPSLNIAFEYQGRQHYEPIDFFGGEDAYQRLKELDARKKRKCKSKRVSLIYWQYDEPVTREVLEKKLIALNQKKGRRKDAAG